jgi:hypothetical protein
MPNPSPDVTPRPAGFFWLHADAPPCWSRRLAPRSVGSPASVPNLGISRRLLRPQPFPRLLSCRTFERTRERRAGFRGIPSPVGAVLPLTFTHAKCSRPQGRPLFCFRVPAGMGYPRGAHPRTPALPCTAMDGPRCTGWRSTGIAESSENCTTAMPTSTPRTTTTGEPFRFGIGGWGGRVPAVGRAETRRCTWPRATANPKRSKNCS